tara:strand:- start:3672 stop:4004 length:333 start_codon:yes stop_codon:yes gene_type:complete
MKTKRLDDCLSRIKDCKTLESISKIDVYEERRFLLNYLPTITSNELGKKSIIRNIDFLLDNIAEQAAYVKRHINQIVSDDLWEAEDIFHSKVEELVVYVRSLEKRYEGVK